MTAVATAEYKRPGREIYWLAAAALAAVVLYAPTFRYMWNTWLSDTQYSLAFLVPLVSGYFTWKSWPEVRKAKRSPSIWGLALIVVGLLMHLGGTVLDVTGPSSFSILAVLVGGLLYFHGKTVVRILAFPLAYLFFMIPIPGGVLDLVGFPLQLWASGTTATVLGAAGLDVVRNGVNMRVGDFDFQVAQACSGLSSLVALVGVTAVFAYVSKLPTGFKWLLFALALPVALAANIIRIMTIAVAGYYYGSDVAMSIFHDWSSPILFMAAIVLLFLVNWGLEWVSARRTTSSS